MRPNVPTVSSFIKKNLTLHEYVLAAVSCMSLWFTFIKIVECRPTSNSKAIKLVHFHLQQDK